LRDDIRPQAAQVVDELRDEGLRSVVLTGDRRAAAEHLRVELKLDDVRAELKPDQKVAAIRELSGQGKKVAMIGDGVNDAPSLAAAHIGVAMGARGSDAALEQADVVLMHDRLENFLAAFRLSQRARRIIRQNLVISLGTVVVLVTFAMLGKIPLPIGVVGHEGSTVVVVMNSLRLLFGGTTSKQK
jgi:Zn2+/Cd2+-exporting ATPase